MRCTVHKNTTAPVAAKSIAGAADMFKLMLKLAPNTILPRRMFQDVLVELDESYRIDGLPGSGIFGKSNRQIFFIAADFVITIRKCMSLIKEIATDIGVRRRVDKKVGDFRAKPAFIPP